MDNKFWIGKWEKNEIGFHQSEYHQNIVKFWQEFVADETGAVFVPLCGKTLDMKFFIANGHTVYGAELSSIAIEAFFEENNLEYSIQDNCYFNEKISIYSGDIFSLKKRHFENVKFIFDRAALVAIPYEIRIRYIKWLHDNFPGANIFLETFYFDNTKIGPPFSMSNKMIYECFGEYYDIEEKQFLSVSLDTLKVHESHITKLNLRTSFLKPK